MIKDRPAEQAVLGALLLDGTKIDNESVVALKPEDFRVKTHQLIYTAMLEIPTHIDIVTLISRLSDTSVKLEYLADLLEATPTAENISYYAKIVKEGSDRMKLMGIAEYIRLNAENGDTKDITANIISSLDKINTTSQRDSTTHINTIMKDTFERVEAVAESPDSVIGIATGFKELDKLTSGFMGGQLIVIGGRPAMGKSAVSGNMEENMALEGNKVLSFNFEMSKEERGIRYLSSTSRVAMQDLKTGQVKDGDWSKMGEAISKHHDKPLWINDTPTLNINQIRAKSRQHKREYGLDIVTLDYLQLIEGVGQSREQEVASISRGLKAMAKELDIPVVVLAQLSRKCEERNDPRPINSDLRESGAIEQDADIIIFVYRDGVYNECQCPFDLTCTCGRRYGAELLIRKQRQGSIGTVDLTFNNKISRFESVRNSN